MNDVRAAALILLELAACFEDANHSAAARSQIHEADADPKADALLVRVCQDLVAFKKQRRKEDEHRSSLYLFEHVRSIYRTYVSGRFDRAQVMREIQAVFMSEGRALSEADLRKLAPRLDTIKRLRGPADAARTLLGNRTRVLSVRSRQLQNLTKNLKPLPPEQTAYRRAFGNISLLRYARGLLEAYQIVKATPSRRSKRAQTRKT